MILRKLIGIGKMTTLALALCGASSLAGCGRSNNPGAIVAPNNSGSVSLALQVGNGTTINSATYVNGGAVVTTGEQVYRDPLYLGNSVVDTETATVNGNGTYNTPTGYLSLIHI